MNEFDGLDIDDHDQRRIKPHIRAVLLIDRTPPVYLQMGKRG